MKRDLVLTADIEAAQAVGPRIVAIGGGTGLSTLLRGLKHCSENLTAVVSVSDDGGGSGLLRHDLGMLPPGDIRACIMALANAEPTMAKLLQYRFGKNSGALSGQSFGNLFLAALNGVCDSFDSAVTKMGEVLAITGRVLPVTNANVHLLARFANGGAVLGESKIMAAKKQADDRITQVQLVPENPPALPDALKAIAEADLIVLGPGSLYTSIIPNLLVNGVVDAIVRSKALKVYVCNIMTQEGETEGYTAYEHACALREHSHPLLFDVCLANLAELPANCLEPYRKEKADPIVLDRDAFNDAGLELVEADLATMQQGVVRHHPLKVACALYDIWMSQRPRDGLFHRYDLMMASWLHDLIDEVEA